MDRPEPDRARGALALALDLSDPQEAFALAERLAPYFGTVKVGLELYTAAGPEIVGRLVAAGHAVFLDLKLHDIPTTVRRAARVVARFGVRYLTVHTSGGAAMLEAAVAGMREGATDAGIAPPVALGVTVLTSEPNPPAGLLLERAQIAERSGLDGIVCAAPDLEIVRGAVPAMLTVVPGTREPSWPSDDQQRVASPSDAIAAGADILVIGRGVTGAADPESTASALLASVTAAFTYLDGE